MNSQEKKRLIEHIDNMNDKEFRHFVTEHLVDLMNIVGNLNSYFTCSNH